MPLYDVKIWYATYVNYQGIEGKDQEDAIYNAFIKDMSEDEEKQVMDNLDALEYDNEATLCADQHTDQQELQDREKDL